MTDSSEERLLRDLAEEGFEVTAVSDLYNRKMNYRAVVPLLIDWLPRASDPAVKEEIARALSVKWAKPHAADVLLAEFARTDVSHEIGLLWALGNAVSVVASDAHFEQVSALVAAPAYGKAREMLVVALGTMRKTPRAEQRLVELLDDEDLVGHALIGLRCIRGGASARQRIEALGAHQTAWVRKEATKLLAKLQEEDRDA